MRSLWRLIKRYAPPGLRPWVQDFALQNFYRPDMEGDGTHPRLGKPTVVFSTDFELAWAWRYSHLSFAEVIEKARFERAQVTPLLKLFDETRVPITWATVGHLGLRACRRENGRAHPASPLLAPYQNPHWKFAARDWYEFDPCSSLAEAPEWYGPDLIERVLAAPAGHELGCHSFSHADSTEAHSSPEFFRAELLQAAEAFAPFGVKPRSFVFPGNLPGHHSILREQGYDIVRDYPWNRKVEFAPPREILPGLWGISQSLYLESPGFEVPYLGRKALRMVEISQQAPRLLSLWFHPSLTTNDLEEVLDPVVRVCAELRDQGEIDILTMGGLADRLKGKVAQ